MSEDVVKDVSLRRLVVEPTPLAHACAMVFLAVVFHIISLRIGVQTGSSLFLGFTLAYLLFSIGLVQRLIGWNRSPLISMAGLSLLGLLAGLSVYQYPDATILITFLFPVVAAVKGGLLLAGLRGRSVESRPRVATRMLTGSAVVFHSVRGVMLLFLVWWFGLGARGISNTEPTRVFYWASLYLGVMVFGYLIRKWSVPDGHPHPDRAKGLVGLSILLIDWSAVSSLRMLDEGQVAATMFEELFMFGLTVLIVLWSRTGSRFSQERLAMVLSLGFAYVIAYAGSISSISVSSDLNVAGVLGLGHALTAIVMALFVIPTVRMLPAIRPDNLLESEESPD
jgi:hypothetical protein